MWSIKQVKKAGNQVLKRNYWVLVFICALLLFLGLLPGGGMNFASLSKSDITGVMTPEEEKEQNGLVRYLDSIIKGESREKQLRIAEEVLESFKGRGGNVYGIVRGIYKFFFAHDTAAKILIIVSLIVFLAFWYFVGSILCTGFCRLSVDGADPEHKIHLSDLFIMFRSNGYLNVVKVLFLWELCFSLILLGACGLIIWGIILIGAKSATAFGITMLVLGALMIIGFYIVYIMLSMVPYILATNPKAKFTESMTLSMSMTTGNKWRIFLLRLSYIGWDLLSILTFGLLNLFYITPSVYMAYGQVYISLRQKAIQDNLPYSYLIESAETEMLPEALQPNRFGEMIENRNPIRHYTIVNIVLMFFIFAFIGWCWEVLIHIIKDGMFVNRGTMHGPWLPIYGFGGAGIVYFLNKLAKKPGLLVAAIFVGCGILEYLAHWYLELTKGIKWWDYSNYFLNLNGRICFEGLFVFCVAGVFAVYVAGPALDNLLNKVPNKTKWIIAGILVAIFAADMAYSHKHPNVGKGITDYGKKVKK